MISRFGAFTLSLTLLACGPAEQTANKRLAITNGVSYAGHPSVGLLIVPGTEPNTVGHCTGTLVGEVTVLTAAHCLTREGKVYFDTGEEHYKAVAVILHPDFDPKIPKVPPEHDIGLVILGEAPALSPMAVSIWTPESGMELLLVGYGTTAEDAKDSGEKRKTENIVDQVMPKRFSISGSSEEGGNLCHGDSGGPALATIEGQEVILGVTSASEGKCGESPSWDTRVDAYLDWLREAAKGDLREGDAEAPVVKVLSPNDGTKVKGEVTIRAEVTDNMGVAEVALIADGIVVQSLDAPPYEFRTKPTPREYLFEVVAKDVAGNEGYGQVIVTVLSDKLTFSAYCQGPDECESGVCFNDPVLEDTYCSQTCQLGKQTCPADSECIPDSMGRHLCAAQLSEALSESKRLEGGCALSAGRGQFPSALGFWLILGWILARRRCAR